jgi:hypothetical protein
MNQSAADVDEGQLDIIRRWELADPRATDGNG